jgi:hypothetical protein
MLLLPSLLILLLPPRLLLLLVLQVLPPLADAMHRPILVA